MHKHTHTDYLPSPFRVVNEYEKEFVRQGIDMLAEGVDDVMKEIARMTAESIKE